jgi:hypothetical protein
MNRKLVGSMAILLAAVEAPAYILIHHWGWLNQDQHSDAVQATTGVVLGIPTLIFAVFAFVATYQSAEASQAQAKAAHAQTAVSELQLEISKATLKEQTRPILNLKRLEPQRPWHDWGQRYEITNAGAGPAHRLEIAAIRADRSAPWGTDRSMMEFLIAPDQSSPILVRGGGFSHLRCFYESLAGHRYVSTFSFTPLNDMVTVYVENLGSYKSLGGHLDPSSMSDWQIAQRDAGKEPLQ